MNKLFEGQRAFATGGGSGIGRACALALALEGCFVTVAGRNDSKLEQTVALIAETGGAAQLRSKIEDNPSRPRYLLTEPGVGYRFQPDEVTD